MLASETWGADRPRGGRSVRPSSDSRPWPLSPTARNGELGFDVVLGEVGLERRRDDRGLGRPRPVREPAEPVEQVGVDQDGRPSGHMPAYMPRWRPAVNPWHHLRAPPQPSQERPRGSIRAKPAHPRPHRPAAERPRRRRAPDDQSPRPRVRGDARADPDRHEAVLRHDERRGDDHDRRIRRPRGGDRQHAVAGRSGPRREHRLVRRPVREDRRDLRGGRHEARRRVGLRGRGRRGPRAPPRACPTSGPSC